MATTSPTRLPWWPLPVCVALAFLIFWPTLEFTAFSDDHSALWNSGVRGIPWRNGFFRPLSDMTFRIGYLAHGPGAAGHRAFNVALHGFNAFLLFALFVRISPRNSEHRTSAGPLVASLLFLLYPFHQESIVWLVGRESSLGTLSVLLGLLLVTTSFSQHVRLVALAACMMVGSLCYESALLLFPLAVVVMWSTRSYSIWTKRGLTAALVCGTATYMALRLTVVGWSNDAYIAGLFTQDVRGLLVRVPKSIARLFLSPDPDTHAQMLKGALLLVGALMGLVALIRVSRNAKWRSDPTFLWIAMLLISCSIPALAGVSTVTSESDRFLYMPSAFLCGLLGCTVQRIPYVALRRAAWVLLAMISFHFLKVDHKNWEQASMATQEIMERLPEAPEHGRLFVTDLPDNHCGAFIFRNGFPEAVFLDGLNGDRYIPVPSATTEHLAAFDFRGRSIIPMGNDQWIHWRDGIFKPD